MVNNRNLDSQKQKNEKALSIMSNILSMCILILTLIYMLGVKEISINIIQSLVVILMLLQTINYWKKNRIVAIMSLCASVIFFVVVILTFLAR